MKILKSAALVSLLFLSHLANAHSGLKYSSPENGALLNELPKHLTLEFAGQVKLVRIQLSEQSGEKLKLAAKPSHNFATTFSIALPVLDSGSYTVKWIAMGKDAHKMKGNFTFIVHGSAQQKIPASSDDHNNAA